MHSTFGAMGVTPIGYLSYFRGLIELLKDIAKDPWSIYNIAIDISSAYFKFLADFAKLCKIRRVWISFANATPAIVGEYYFEKIVWPSTKKLLEGLLKENITPIIQFDEEVKSLKFLSQIPRGSLIVHVSSDSNLIRHARELSDFACIAGNFKIPVDEREIMRINNVLKEVRTSNLSNLIISTDGGSPFILTKDNASELLVLELFKKCEDQ